MSRRFGKKRVPDCECTQSFTCGPCLRSDPFVGTPAPPPDMVLAYRATILAKSGTLVGGGRRHDSTPFASPFDAKAWADVILQSNKEAGRDAELYPIHTVKARRSTIVHPSQVRLLKDKHYPAAWVMTFKPIKAGTIVPVLYASNIPQAGDAIRYWVMTEELKDDAYGIGLYDGDFEFIP